MNVFNSFFNVGLWEKTVCKYTTFFIACNGPFIKDAVTMGRKVHRGLFSIPPKPLKHFPDFCRAESALRPKL